MSAVLCIGEALIDMFCTDFNRPLQQGENFVKKAGGAPANVAAAIVAMGGKASLAAKVGVDPFGKFLRETIASYGVDIQHILSSPDHFTTLAFVSLLDQGERDFYFSRGADGQYDVSAVERIDLAKYAVVHFGSATAFLPGPLQTTYAHLFHKAITNNLFVSFDPNYRQLLFPNNTEYFIESCWKYFPHADFIKVSEEEACMLTRQTTSLAAATEFRKNGAQLFAITLGKEGTLFGHPDGFLQVPSIPIQPIDTTGAGDAFVGAVLYQIAKENFKRGQSPSIQEFEKIIATANKVAAKTCEHLGAMESFKHLNLMERESRS